MGHKPWDLPWRRAVPFAVFLILVVWSLVQHHWLIASIEAVLLVLIAIYPGAQQRPDP